MALEGILARVPEDDEALVHLAQCQLRRGRAAAAIDALDRAERRTGTTRFTAQLRGDVLYKLRRYADAARCYRDASALGHAGSWPLARLARCLMHLDDLDGARQAATIAVERDPAATDGWVVRGEVALAMDEPDEAEVMLARAHEQDPKNGYAYAKLVEARLLALPPESRDRELRVLLKSTGSGNRHLLQVLARLQGRMGDADAAAGTWRRSRQGSDDDFALKMEAYALRKAGKLADAAAAMRQSLLDDPQDVILFRTYVRLQHEREALDELRRTLEELLPTAGSRRGAVYGELRKLSGARPRPD